MVMKETNLNEQISAGLLKKYGSVRKAVDSYKKE